MKTTKTMTLDDEDKKIANIFMNLGMPKNFSKTLVYISQVDEWNAVDIEKIVSIRQPNVSIIMKEFEKRGWIKKRANEKQEDTKGRPTYIYSKKLSMLEIVGIFKKEKLEEIKTMTESIDQLDRLDSLFNR